MKKRTVNQVLSVIIWPGKCLKICIVTILGWRTKWGSVPLPRIFWGEGGGGGGGGGGRPPPPPPPPPPVPTPMNLTVTVLL